MPELDRRDFLKLVGIGAGAAAASGCEPVEKLVPYVIQPESVTPGIAVSYASTCTECQAACGLHIKTREGRPIKVEGNPDHPVNKGALCARGQASFSRAYHPDRHTGPLAKAGDGSQQAISWDDATAKVAGAIKQAAGGVWLLGGPVGPSLSGVIEQFMAAAKVGGRVVYAPLGYESLRKASEVVFGTPSYPIFDVSKADLVVDLGSDFIDTGLSPTEGARQLAEARDLHGDHGGARMISIGPRMNLTVQAADHWIPAKAGSEGLIALALAKAVLDKKGTSSGDTAAVKRFLASANAGTAASRAGIERSQLDAVADKLLQAKHPVVLPPNASNNTTAGTATAAAVLVLNDLLGAVGSQVVIPAATTNQGTSSMADVEALVAAMKAGRVKVLLIHDANPVYSLPQSSGFQEALGKVNTVVSFASLRDETSVVADFVLPDHAAVESWGDAEPRAGVRSLVQPTIRPLHDTQSLGDALLVLGRALGGSMPEGSFRQVVESNWSDTNFRDALGRGGVFGDTPSQPVAISRAVGGLRFEAPSLAGSGDKDLIVFEHSFLGDGSSAALPWMQETPHPVTKLSWNSWVEMSFATAEDLGVTFGDVVEVNTDNGSLEVSAFPRGGIRDDAIAIALGQGHTVGHYASMEIDGEPGVARGVNAIAILPASTDESGGRVWLGSRASVSKTGRFRRLALSQWTDNQRERGLGKSMALSALSGHGEEHGGAHHDGPPHTYKPEYDAKPDQPYRWGMVIDNDRCNGCSACITACSIENNIAVVGETQAIMHREMNWMRIERYIGDGDRSGGAERRPFPNREVLGEVDVRHVPSPCQHCGAAPCEAVCPVIATYHNDEGLNGMVYNRCVGTRYCANNCTYKVRRFNYFDYGNDNWPGMLGLMLNPDVTVRQQGVMEKCSFCVQRIEAARQPAKDEGREIRDGEVTPACQQTCPTGAITFGNWRDHDSQVSQTRDKNDNRSYALLQELNTRPALTYLAQVKRDDLAQVKRDDEGSH